jgi:uncharacterized membrane protein YfcA
MDMSLLLVALAGFIGGVANVLAGGGGFFTFPALLLAGLDPRAANVTGTVGIWPMQVTVGYAGLKHIKGTSDLPLRIMLPINFVGGIAGALLLLSTPPSFFAALVPWLVLFATGAFAWGSFRKTQAERPGHRLGRTGSMLLHSFISIYVGYYGGGAGILVLAVLTLAGMPVRMANRVKLLLVCAANTAAVAIFLFSKDIHWVPALIILAASEFGAHVVGVRILHRVNEKALKIGIICFGLGLSVWLFVR